jgi:hypothetical protein
MEVIRPYLFGPGGPDGSGLGVTCDIDTGILDLVVRGRFGRRSATDTFTGLRTCLAVERYFPVRATPAEARAVVLGTVPWTQRLQLIQRAPNELSTCNARNLVGAACEAWRMPDLLHPARIIVSELVTNALEHAGTDVTVTVWRRGEGLHLSVRDGDPRFPRLLDASSGAPGERGAGLRIVGARATAWGAMATPDGKLVWATLRGAR